MAWAALGGTAIGLAVRGILPGLVVWGALVPLLLLLREERNVLRSSALTLVANLGIQLAAFEGALPAIPWAFPLTLLFSAPYGAAPGFLAARLVKLEHRGAVLWLVPIAWTAAEFVASRRWLWGQVASPVSLGYTQLDSPLLHLAAITGVGGVGLAVLLINAAIAGAVSSRRSSLLLVPVCAMLLALPFQGVKEFGEEERMTVGVVQPALEPLLYSAASTVPEAGDEVIQQLLQLTEPIAGADLILWPEGALPPTVVPDSVPRLLPDGPIGVGDMLLGAVSRREGTLFNSAVAVTGGSAEVVFDKLAPVPLGEAGVAAGDVLVVGRWGGYWLGPLICLDSLYPEFAVGLARFGAELLVVLSDDSFARSMATPHLHSRATAFRAVETGLPVVFVSANGPSTVISSDGRFAQLTSVGESTSFVATVSPTRSRTLFVRLGDWVGPLCVLVLGVTFLALSASERRTGARSQRTVDV